MSATAESRPLRLVAGTVQRRWRLGALLGLLVGLALAAYSLIVLGPGAELSQMVPVLRAARAIQAGNTITADELTTSLIRTQDASVLATLLRDTDRSRIVGQVAALDVPAGDLIPAGRLLGAFRRGQSRLVGIRTVVGPSRHVQAVPARSPARRQPGARRASAVLVPL